VALIERAAGTGLGALILGATIADRLGLRLGSRPVAICVLATVAVAGWLVAVVASRVRSQGASPPGATTTRTTRGSLPSSIAPSLP
jgi:hypothetical protein